MGKIEEVLISEKGIGEQTAAVLIASLPELWKLENRQITNLNRGKSAHIALITYVCNSNLFILDEPTIGLHPKDAEILLKNLRQLQRKGANIVVIEHDIDVIQQSDYIIEMGEKSRKVVKLSLQECHWI